MKDDNDIWINVDGCLGRFPPASLEGMYVLSAHIPLARTWSYSHV